MNEPARKAVETPAGETDAPARRPAFLERLLRRSAAALLVERLWRVCAALSALVLLFLALSWSGLWLETSPLWRIVGLASFVLAGAYVALREILRGPPRRKEALARLDASADPALRPAASLEDRLAGDNPDPATRALWTLHRRRLERALKATSIAPPAPRLAERDPFALRALALVAAVAMGFVAGDAKLARLRAAFDWRLAGGGGGETARFDAWLDPPPYTGRPPLVLAAEDADAARPTQAPVNSILHVRQSNGSAVTTSGALAELADAPEQGKSEPTKSRAAAPPSERERKFKLTGPARLALPSGRGLDLAVIPDEPPRIALTEPARNNSRGSLMLAYRTEDDYGVIGAEAVVSRPGGPRTLVPPPKFPLTLPAGREGLGEARSTLDLADNPWAGGRATLALLARDEGGNQGLSQPIDLTLPQRRFAKPLARALVEQRRNLVLDPDGRVKVLVALEALSVAPDLFETPSSIHLGLRAARRGLEGKRDDDDLLAVADMLWAMALSLEGGDLSQAERDLRAAQNNLREALVKGAPDEEIDRLTQELRQAMDKFLQGLAEQAARKGDKASAPQADESGNVLTEDDLKSMLDEMAKASKSGDHAEAQRLLDQLQDMLENLQPSKGASARQRDMSRAMSELDRLSREQQQLRDDTYQEPKPGEDQRAKPGAERQRQQSLRERLQRQRDELRRAGEDAPSDLSDADKAMKEAEEALKPDGAGRGKAVDAQGRALQALRRGADQLAERMKGAGEEGADGGEEGGQGERPGRAHGQGQGEDQDPLGRSGRYRGYDKRSRYDPMGLPPALRARRVQEELRRRLGQPERPAEEMDYLQRLLRR
jgi:uncharacterized protein (TIGR02302 family)